tara:strand:- start:4449 stop:4649 length:201 start_codon:yes stop_codon:yes gene_type:complete
MNKEQMKLLINAKIINVLDDISLVLQLDKGELLRMFPLRDGEVRIDNDGNALGSWGFALIEGGNNE